MNSLSFLDVLLIHNNFYIYVCKCIGEVIKINPIYVKYLVEYLKANGNKGTVTGFSLYLESRKAPYASESFCRNVCKRAEAQNLIIYIQGNLTLTNGTRG
jgi:hypothetical protein